MREPLSISKIEKEMAKKKIEVARMQRDAAKKEADDAKKEYTAEKLRVAFERLQLNWIKWNITCIALGFTAYKFWYARVHDEGLQLGYYITGREIGIFLIVLGFVSLLMATRQHKRNIRNLKLSYKNMQPSISLKLSNVTLVFSVIVFLLVIFRT
ncbi:MAG TPA: DUF202 domain-containing protein [Chitinophagaceae bacterium]|nr:DUF202 domain-containing protein [Chitinophagaceae bacterium]